MAGPNPDRTPCACGSYACLVQSPLMCRHTGVPRAANPFAGPGSVRLRTHVAVLNPMRADHLDRSGEGGVPAPDPRHTATQRARQSTPGRRKK